MNTGLGIVIGIAVGLVLVFVFRYLRGRIRSEGHKPSTTPVAPGEQSSSTAQTPETRIDKNVQFTVYRPATIIPEKWYPLVAFAHLSRRRDDAPADEPDPIKEVERQAAKLLSDQPAKYEASKLDRGFSVPRKGLLTFVPLIEGCEFNPPTQSVEWQRTVHKVEFEMMASASVDKREVEGQMTVYLGNIILTEVPLRLYVDSSYVAPESQQGVMEGTSAEPYRKIFASYSHKDTAIVEDFENYVESLGDEYLRDVRTLRSGQKWSEELEHMIRDASVFQLFWSSNSMMSDYVKQEWEYALGLNRGGKFIRPVYWEEPLPKKDPDLPPRALSELHFYKLSGPEKEEKRGGVIPPVIDPRESVIGTDKVTLETESRIDTLGTEGGLGTSTGSTNAIVDEGVLSDPPRPFPLRPISVVALTAFVALAGIAIYVGYRLLSGPPDPEPPIDQSPTTTPTPTPTVFGGDVVSPTISPTPESSPTTTPGSSPLYSSPTPVISPSPTPVISPTPRPSPSPSPSPRHEPSPTPTPTPKPTPIPITPAIAVSINTATLTNENPSGTYRLTIENVGSDPIKDIQIVAVLPAGLLYAGSKPTAVRRGKSTLIWQLDQLQVRRLSSVNLNVRLGKQLKKGEKFSPKLRTVVNYSDSQGRRHRYPASD